jgi:hypothetical protein
MPESLVVSPGDRPGTCRDQSGKVLPIPNGWALLPPGDAGLTRRVKAAGPTWNVQEKKGRRVFSRGVWADARIIEEKKKELEQERSTEAYAKRKAADKTRRDKKQANYVDEFEAAVFTFLNFAPRYEEIASQLAARVTAHATPVGSGTVARTETIPVERRAESAVIAWMRHQTTAYDSMKIARIRGERRNVRRQLAERSIELLENYRLGKPVSLETCPLQIALRNQP